MLDASLFHLTQTRNSDLGFALAFPFSSTALTVSGFETFGDNQFATPITLFPDLRNQDKYQLRYDLSHSCGTTPLGSASTSSTNPSSAAPSPTPHRRSSSTPTTRTFTSANPEPSAAASPRLSLLRRCSASAQCNPAPSSDSGIDCAYTPASEAPSHKTSSASPSTRKIHGEYPISSPSTTACVTRPPGDSSPAPAAARIRTARTSPCKRSRFPSFPACRTTTTSRSRRASASPTHPAAVKNRLPRRLRPVLDDLAQNGWATAFQGVNNTNAVTGPCSLTGGPGTYALSGPGCLQGGAGATGNLVGSPYKTPYAIHITGGVQHAFNQRWLASADYVHEQGNHGYRAFPYTSAANLFTPLIPSSDPDYATDQINVVPNVNVFESDNRSSYNALMLHVQGNIRRFSLVANYTFSKAQTWGCVLGELFDMGWSLPRADRSQRRTARRVRTRRLRPFRRRRSPSLGPRRHGSHPRRIRTQLRLPERKRAPHHHHQRRQQRPHLEQRRLHQPRRIPRNALHPVRPARHSSLKVCAAGESAPSPNSSTSSTATIPARTSPSTLPSSPSPPTRCSPAPPASPTSPKSAPSPTAPRPNPSPVSSS